MLTHFLLNGKSMTSRTKWTISY